MTVENIIPCICTTHTPIPTVNAMYGMPILLPCNAGKHKQYWHFQCPVCGRGGFGITEAKTAYKALQQWNKLQEGLYRMADREIVFEKEWEENDPDAGYEENKWEESIMPGRFVTDMTKASREWELRL